MRLVAMSRSQLEGFVFPQDEKSAVITIAYSTDRDHYVPAVGFQPMSVLYLHFDDCTPEGVSLNGANNPERPIPMSRTDAIAILSFARTCIKEGVEVIYAACFAGHSRSRGVLAGLAAIFGWDDAELYSGGNPNPHCKALIVRTARENLDFCRERRDGA